MSTGEVIGDGVLLGGDIGDPVVAVDVADAEEVEASQAERHLPAVGSGEVVGEEEVDGVALIGG